MVAVTLKSTLVLEGREAVDTASSPTMNTINQEYVYSGWNEINASATLDVAPAYFTSGTATVDLTAITLARDVTQTQDLTGKKLRAVDLKAPSTNAANVSITVGASNGYPLAGSSFTIELAPGDRMCFLKAADGTAVSSSAKTLDVTVTSTDVLEAMLYFDS